MTCVELTDGVEDFGRLAGLVEETGERVILTEDGTPVSVLLPAAELAELEYWAQRGLRAPIPLPEAAEEWPPGPAQHGPYMRYVHVDGGQMTFTRDRVLVAELRDAAWLDWLEEQALHARQGYMSPKQAAAFAEFLARQPPVGEQ
ncbi:type II toxin-antitoxin system Phd/YefM family antitoxin [Streptomyces sp. NBC_01381]|uniref:type II toxin-antitoxin system Phd/YefM family antitoxin n=1 Tax=Streptomyces sp. NBC_01381 TaxID=2903845 RepID=UPI002258A323|nr:type II toxin-antitoxin system Phd/YefM family antitoxin [Streptomyces sp. NBC_01381]MCX4673407.1 type II toxin-antitoxin system Phd/YefM family antitoxin [Streptomyces sp. NBC_01381]